MRFNWEKTCEDLRKISKSRWLDNGQVKSLHALGCKLAVTQGCVIADEVGMGKTRIAIELAKTVVRNGGRVCFAIPPGLAAQWNGELKYCPDNDLFTIPEYFIIKSVEMLFKFFEDDEVHKESINDLCKYNTIFLSHFFTNSRITSRSGVQKWGLLPLIYAVWRKNNGKKYPNGFKDSIIGELDIKVKDRYFSYANNIISKNTKFLNNIFSKLELSKESLKNFIFEPSNYIAGSQTKNLFENVIGLFFGNFDLVVLDEAHKAKTGGNSNISRLVSNVINNNPRCRHIAITATPVALDVSEWSDILKRIKICESKREEIVTIATEYINILDKLRLLWKTDDSIIQQFADVSIKFQQILSPYVIRRDKREIIPKDLFQTYRKIEKIEIEPCSLTSNWKQIICAAESLSFNSISELGKRLRLTIGDSYGLCEYINADKDLICENDENDNPIKNKKLERIKFWKRCIPSKCDAKIDTLFNDPVIRATMKKIEAITSTGEKVLVFGRFNTPLLALSAFLNAREMVRRILDTSLAWPQEVLPPQSLLSSAVKQELELRHGAPSFSEFQKLLAKRYDKIEGVRKKFRSCLMENIKEGLKKEKNRKYFFTILEQISKCKDVNDAMTRAIMEISGFDVDCDINMLNSSNCANAFLKLWYAGINDDDLEDDDENFYKFSYILKHEFDEHHRSTFCRVLYGDVKLQTRRFVQISFNQENSWPKVLIGQSQIISEGLNLHEYCRHVILMHHEWNPGVVEQQIGRVDRHNCLWKKYVDKGITDRPITIYPVIFKETYDEHHWNILEKRWKNLRAQLHGEILDGDDGDEVIKEINSYAPDFSPVSTK